VTVCIDLILRTVICAWTVSSGQSLQYQEFVSLPAARLWVWGMGGRKLQVGEFQLPWLQVVVLPLLWWEIFQIMGSDTIERLKDMFPWNVSPPKCPPPLLQSCRVSGLRETTAQSPVPVGLLFSSRPKGHVAQSMATRSPRPAGWPKVGPSTVLLHQNEWWISRL
jgi:hypothetical protein